jgi:hypothetical protein
MMPVQRQKVPLRNCGVVPVGVHGVLSGKMQLARFMAKRTQEKTA